MNHKRLNSIELSNTNPDKVLQLEIFKYLKNRKFKKVLDYGAGNSPYRKYVKCDEYITLDIAQNKKKNVNIIIKSNSKIPIKKNYFDFILLIDVISHIYDFDSVLKECHRVLKKKGKILIFTPFIYRENETPNDYWRFTSFAIKKIISKHKYKNIKIKKIGNANFTIYSINQEKNIMNKEIINSHFINRVIKKIINYILLPFYNIFIFEKPPLENSGTYHHLITIAKK